MNVTNMIGQAIQQASGQKIPFRTYMNYALYAPEGGYYQRETQKIGKQGDFYTNASVGSVYGDVLGNVIWEMITNVPGSSKRAIVEMGGGSGQLSAQILDYLRQTNRLNTAANSIAYIMIEASAYHRKLQQEALSRFQDMIEIRWYESIAHAKADQPELRGVLFSNELPDAFPVHLIEYRRGSWHEVYVTEGKKDGTSFTECLGPLSTPQLASFIKRENIPSLEGYRTEVNLDSLRWMEEVAKWLTEGYVLTVDYGYEREALYAPSRKTGTLLCYRGHTMSDNPYKEPGTSDITSHVNFSALVEEGKKHGLATIGFYTQQQFLMQAGILTYLQEHAGGDPFRNETAKRNRAIRQLIMGEGMGRAFRVLLQGKNTNGELTCCKPWSMQS